VCSPNATGSHACPGSASSCSASKDGLLVPLAVVTGLAGADVASSTVLVGGLAEAAAGALAMGTGAFLASQAENQLFRTEIADEEAELDDHPEIEREELAILLREEGLSEQDARSATERIARSRRSLIKTKVEKELGLAYEDHETALGDALIVGLAYRGEDRGAEAPAVNRVERLQRLVGELGRLGGLASAA
jgi:VIT1/CCC1 family predicted Fe2+/Mn2+ transporter